MKPELSYLAHNLVEIDKYRVETCCVIGKGPATTQRTESHTSTPDINPYQNSYSVQCKTQTKQCD